jgi:hypothetical protein
MKVYQKDKLVMNVNNEPEKIRVVDRLNMFVVRTKQFKTKSDAMCYLLNTAMDLLEEQEEQDMTTNEMEKKLEKEAKEMTTTTVSK